MHCEGKVKYKSSDYKWVGVPYEFEDRTKAYVYCSLKKNKICQGLLVLCEGDFYWDNKPASTKCEKCTTWKEAGSPKSKYPS